MSLENFDKLIEQSVNNATSFRFSNLKDLELRFEERRSLKDRYSHLLTLDKNSSDSNSGLFDYNRINQKSNAQLIANGRSYSRSVGNDLQLPVIQNLPQVVLTSCSACCYSTSESSN